MYELIKTLPYWFQVLLLIVPILSFLITACAFVIHVEQTMLNNTLGRAKIVSEYLHTFMDDDMMHRAFYKIEYSQFKYDSGFHTSDEEREIDKLLRHFSNLALMWEHGLLNLKDIYPVQYFIIRIANDANIRKYLLFINSWADTAGTGSHPYSSLSALSSSLTKRINA